MEIFFEMDADDGNYLIRLKPAPGGEGASVWAEARRLMLRDLRRAPGAPDFRDILVNARDPQLEAPEPNAPGGSRVLLGKHESISLDWDGKLSLAASGPAPEILSAEKTEKPRTVFILGDSTVADQADPPYSGWGQMLPCFFRADTAVANHAQSGETLKSFLTELRLAKVLSLIRPGDWLLIQFCHNDQKDRWPQTWVDADTTYKAYLRCYIEEARLRGAFPALVTAPQRRNFDGKGKVVDTHGRYPEAMREVAAETDTPLVDLEAMSRAFYEALGPEGSAAAFVPGDLTHHSEYGAYELARCVARGLHDAAPGLAPEEGSASFDPARPDSPESLPFLRSGA
jgi:lysophospholipase L1-like esterase